jgi:hypothetical protein
MRRFACTLSDHRCDQYPARSDLLFSGGIIFDPQQPAGAFDSRLYLVVSGADILLPGGSRGRPQFGCLQYSESKHYSQHNPNHRDALRLD